MHKAYRWQHRIICDSCGEYILACDAVAGINIPEVTNGPKYFCPQCAPPQSVEKTIREIEDFVTPPKE